MAAHSILTHTLCVLPVYIAIYARCLNGAATFDQNYFCTWGHNNIINRGQEAELILNNKSGSGFRSKLDFASGFFEMKIKLPTGRSRGVITTFYLNSLWNDIGDHDELDFEFIGENDVYPFLQTNVYTMDNGCREERYDLPFNPTEDYHKYQILWNQNHIVFFIDDSPIRVFNNYKHMGVKFPSQQMHIEGTIWDGHVWASPDGREINWTLTPSFHAQYQWFDIYACQYDTSNVQRCYNYSPDLWWNGQTFSSLNDKQMRDLANFRRQYLTYDYCTDPSRNGRAECHIRR
ncbi:hypothetical protein QQ045_008484 [Rhodiola kirilowii]